MKRSLSAALAVFFVGFGAVSPGLAQSALIPETIEEQRLLGSGDEDARARDLLPFTRSFGASGSVTGSLAESTAAAGVPAAAMLEAARAFEREPQQGDAFYVRWQQTYNVEGQPI